VTNPIQQPTRSAAWAVFGAFGAAGFAIGTFASRIPAISSELHLSGGELGSFLMMWAIGSVVALPASGMLTERLGTRGASTRFAILTGAAQLSLIVAVLTGHVILASAALFLVGAGAGLWDASITVEGATVEQRLGTIAMPRFQAGESLGTALGAGLGAVMAALHLPLLVHFGVAIAFYTATGLVCARAYLPASATNEPAPSSTGVTPHRAGRASPTALAASSVTVPPESLSVPSWRTSLAAWREPRTLLLGLVILGAALADGAGGDWTSQAILTGFHTSEATAALGTALFFGAALTLRLAAGRIVARFGTVRTLRGCSLVTLVGVTLFALSPWLPLALAGTVLWGCACALGFPLGVSSAADDPAKAAHRVAAASTIGYLAFIMGPLVIGLLSEVVGYRLALLFIVIPIAVALVAAGSARPSSSNR
jgi:MFS family permease